MALILNYETGYISPQFHVKFDKRFTMVTDDKSISQWHMKAGFKSTYYRTQRKKLLPEYVIRKRDHSASNNESTLDTLKCQ